MSSEQSASQSGGSSIYIGNLDQRVTDTMLHDLFATLGTVLNVKIVTMRRHAQNNNHQNNVNYGFIEFEDAQVAQQALETMNGRKIFNHDIRLNWAQGPQAQKGDTASHFHIFVGDLAPEITDDMLVKAFSNFGTMSDAHVMWDTASGKSRGFGFVAFRDKTDAEQAIATMNGEWLGSRPIRCNWATQKGQTATPPPQPGQQLPYQIVIQQTPNYVTSVYVGNLPPETTESDIRRPFEQMGRLTEVRLQAERGFAFVKMDTHENAASAIVQLQGIDIQGRPAKLSWGKDRAPTSHHHQNWHHGGHSHLYAGRAGHNNRIGGGGIGHHTLSGSVNASSHNNNSNATGADGQPLDEVAPNSLASLDPHASGTQAATAPGGAAQWSQQVSEQAAYDQYNTAN
ncbi:hypothetical protein BCR43DRAFT_491972 [Syncephalastrum racemosum]|uniref:RRM domain-containing protein n=1 Tax=Syncephalastrum racemosum TaxID=13706 RepID=A0A1X2HCU9_SYNRA|nr:hypothetical protein BCR43DRAFT_491972 [Syncephalastrum racemosum]